MTNLYLALLAAYVLFALALNHHEKEARNRIAVAAATLVQTALFGMAFWVGAKRGVLSRDLVSPIGIGAGLVAGHLIFGVSLLISDRSLRDAAEHFVDLPSLWSYAVESPSVLSRLVAASISEEMIYRVAAQTMLIERTGRPILSILAIAMVFCVVHRHFFRNSLIVSLEFVGFAVLLGALYYWTGSLILVLVIHAVRNIEIDYLEYLVKSYDEGAADPEEQLAAT